MRALASVLIAFAGCSFGADYAGTHYLCGAGDSCPSGFTCVGGACVLGDVGPDASPAAPDGGPALGTWRSDSADDFGAGGFAVDHAANAARGAIEPYAYYSGGVLQTASATGFTSGAGTTWAQVAAFPSTNAISIQRSADPSWGTGTPAGVGLTAADGWTLRFEGEIWLGAGDWSFYLLADDHGFLELADAGGAYARVVSADYPNEASGTFHAAADGWYPLRWALSDSGGSASFRIRYQGPGTSLQTIPRYRLRARTDDRAGLVEQAFDGALFDGNRAMTIDLAPAATDWGAGAPADLGLSSADEFSERWSGQWRVDTDGTYALRYDSDDGQRLWIDGAPMTSDWDGNTHTDVTAPLALAAGWHDVVIDHSEQYGNAKAMLTIDSGPELVGQPLPADRLRAVEGRGERYEHVANHNDIAIPDAPSASVDGTADSSVSVGAPPGAVVHGVEIGLFYDHEWQGDLRIELVAPSGKRVVLRDTTGNQGGSFYDHFVRTDLDGEPAGGTWTAHFVDTDPGAVGTIRDVELTVHTQGAGTPPIAPAASYTSAVHDLGGAATIGAVRWGARTPDGTGVTVSVRAGATAADCAAAAWSPPLASGDAASLSGAFVQYRVVLASDGDATPSLEWIELDTAR